MVERDVEKGGKIVQTCKSKKRIRKEEGRGGDDRWGWYINGLWEGERETVSQRKRQALANGTPSRKLRATDSDRNRAR